MVVVAKPVLRAVVVLVQRSRPSVRQVCVICLRKVRVSRRIDVLQVGVVPGRNAGQVRASEAD